MEELRHASFYRAGAPAFKRARVAEAKALAIQDQTKKPLALEDEKDIESGTDDNRRKMPTAIGSVKWGRTWVMESSRKKIES